MEVIPTGDLKLSSIPQAEDLEQSVLGVFLIEENSFSLYADRLHEGCFYSPKNQIVFKAIYSLFKAGKSIDLLTVADEARKLTDDPQIAYYCTVISNMVASSAHMAEWVQVLIEKFISRQIIKISQQAYYGAMDPAIDPLELFANTQKKLSDILNKSAFYSEKSFAEILEETIADMREAKDHRNGVIGVQTKNNFIDRNMMGLVAPDLTIIAARPGEGKSTLAFNIAVNMARENIPVGFFSFEMKDRQLMWKTISHFLPEDVNTIRSGQLTDVKWNLLGDQYATIAGLPIWINDKGFLNVEEMKAIIKTWIIKHGIKAVFIDYLQLIASSPELRRSNREAQVSYNSRFIKSIAMECNIPIILLSQLSRQGANIEPELHHLRESGAIEQDADNVLFIHHNDEETENKYPGWVEGDPEWVVELMLKKCRLGTKGKRQMILNAAHNTFREVGIPEGLTPINYRDYSEPQDNPF